MRGSICLALVAGLFAAASGSVQAAASLDGEPPSAYRAAVAVLVDDARFRAQLEESLVTKGRQHGFDLVASHTLLPDARDLSAEDAPALLGTKGVQVVVMLRPAAVGPGTSLEAVRDSLPPGLYSQMRRFAATASAAGPDDLIAVVQVAIYALASDEPRLATAGAVWLSEPVASREEGIAKLEDMLLQNVEAAREQIRRNLDRAAGR